MRPTAALVEPYYRSALTALRYLDERIGRRRFGLDADARWNSFAGDDPSPLHDRRTRIRLLTVADRIDLLLRDADIQWPGAFGARTVFDLTDVPEDDAFGHEWTPCKDAATLWQQVTLPPLIPDLNRLIHCIFDIWSIALVRAPLPPLRPNARWSLHGPFSVAAAIAAFAGEPAVVWHSQVLVVAGSPLAPGLSPQQRLHRGLTRQLAALAAGLLGQPKPTRILTADSDETRGHQRLGAATEAA